MTRILYWNIENFAVNKLNDPDMVTVQRGSALSRYEASQRRRAIVNAVLQAAQPEVVVIVEVSAQMGVNRGTYVPTGGARASLELRAQIEVALAQPLGWSLVPPLQTGSTEAVSVFYRRQNRFFAGPYVWPGAIGPSVAPGPAVVPANYPPAMHAQLPNRAVPAGALQNVAVNERQCAACTAFNTIVPAGPAVWPARQRAPYLVSLFEAAVAPLPPRTLTLFAIHAPASHTARAYVTALANLAEIAGAPAANEVRVIVGDFNVELMTAALALDPAYAALTAAPAPGYALGLTPAVPPPPAATVRGYRGFYATHIRPREKVSCQSTRGQTTFYPGYGYIGSQAGIRLAAIDNVLVRGAAPLNVTILNPIVGSPFNGGNAAWNNGPPGVRVLARRTTIPPPPELPGEGPQFAPPPPLPALYGAGLQAAFRGWEQYGKIRSLSDHFPIVFDV